jgi:hypothetical protein
VKDHRLLNQDASPSPPRNKESNHLPWSQQDSTVTFSMVHDHLLEPTAVKSGPFPTTGVGVFNSIISGFTVYSGTSLTGISRKILLTCAFRHSLTFSG